MIVLPDTQTYSSSQDCSHAVELKTNFKKIADTSGCLSRKWCLSILIRKNVDQKKTTWKGPVKQLGGKTPSAHVSLQSEHTVLLPVFYRSVHFLWSSSNDDSRLPARIDSMLAPKVITVIFFVRILIMTDNFKEHPELSKSPYNNDDDKQTNKLTNRNKQTSKEINKQTRTWDTKQVNCSPSLLPNPHPAHISQKERKDSWLQLCHPWVQKLWYR